MKRVRRIALVVFLVLLLGMLVGPFLVPVPALDTVPTLQLADPDSQFTEVDGLTAHFKSAGSGERALLLLHGFGASVFSWREVMQPLAENATVIAFDRPAHGLTERPLAGEWEGPSPYSVQSQAEQTVGLMDALGIERAILVGNSAGGTVALLTALSNPERVAGLVLVSPAVYSSGGLPGWLNPLLRTPQMRRLGPLLVRSIADWGEQTIYTAWHDPGRVTSEILAGYKKPLQADYWDRALWELTAARDELDLPGRLTELSIPTLVITGDDDRIVPTEQSVQLAGELPNAELVVLPSCGHVPQEECPAAFLEAVAAWLASE